MFESSNRRKKDRIQSNNETPSFSHGVFMTLALFIFLGCNSAMNQERFDPVGLFLTWQYDPTTSMTIDWHTQPEDGNQHMQSVLQFKKLGDDNWREVNGAYHQFPHSQRHIHRVTLRNLEPGTTYRFRFGSDTESYRFETMPENLEDEPLTFAAGGDSGHDEDFERMNRVVMEYDPDFIYLGGDITYANGDPARIDRWYSWFDIVKETLIDEDGLVTPFVITIGNHELFGIRRPLRGSSPHDEMTETEARDYMDEHNLWDGKPTFFFDVFAFPGKPSYNVLDFGDYLSLIALDSDHYSNIEGAQTAWLEAVLAEREDRTHVLPKYHVPAWPSHRSMGSTRGVVREHWPPLFEEYNVRVAFENHDHTYKRTYPIRDGERVAEGEGVVYLGDGNWARNPRVGENRDQWYINEFKSVQHAYIGKLHADGTQEYVAVSSDGEEFDSYTSPAP